MKSRRPSLQTRKLLFQPLEPRLALAGNVTATVVNGNLVLLGDDLANDVFVGDLSGGQFAITGITGITGGSTTINGQERIVVSGVKSITANLAGGSDRFFLSADSDLNGGNPFRSGWGSAMFGPLLGDHGYAQLSGQLSLDLGDGHDTAVITASATEGMEVNGGDDAGDDGLFLRTNDTQVTRSLLVHLGEGNDYTALSISNLSELLRLDTAGGNDSTFVAFRAEGNLQIDTGSGDDRLVLEGNYGGASDLTNHPNQALSIVAGEGNDNVDVSLIETSGLIVNMGGGLDALAVRGVAVSDYVYLRGGGTLGSSIVFTDAMWFGSSIDSAGVLRSIRHIDTRIGGDVTISFNYDEGGGGILTAPEAPQPTYQLTVGQKSDVDTDGFSIGGTLWYYGSILEDTVTINPLRAANLVIDTGYGDDWVAISGVDIASNVIVFLNDGNDRGLIIQDFVEDVGNLAVMPRVKATTIGGDLRVNYGSGHESESHRSLAQFVIGARKSGLTSRFTVMGNLEVIGGDGRNDLEVVAAKLGAVNLRLGGQAANLNMHVVIVDRGLYVAGGTESSDLSFGFFGVGGYLVVDTGDGNDNITISNDLRLNSNIRGDLRIDTRDGNDHVEVGITADVIAAIGNPRMTIEGNVSIHSGSGDDEVKLGRLRGIDYLAAQLGDGDDLLDLLDIYAQSGSFTGGFGSNDRLSGTFHYQGQNHSRSGFEVDELTATADNTLVSIPISVPGIITYDYEGGPLGIE